MQEHRVVINIEVAVVRGDGRYLTIVRGAGEDHAAGLRALPGGKLDFDLRAAALEATAIREVAEETGLRIADPVYVESHTFSVPLDGASVPVVDIVFIARHTGGDPVPGDPAEVASIEWRSAAELSSDLLTPPWMHESMALVERKRMALGW